MQPGRRAKFLATTGPSTVNAVITFQNAAEAMTALYVCGHLASNHAEASSDDTRCLAVVSRSG